MANGKDLYAVVLLDTSGDIAAVLPMCKEDWHRVSGYDAASHTNGKFYINTKERHSNKRGDDTMHIGIFIEASQPVPSQEQEVSFHA